MISFEPSWNLENKVRIMERLSFQHCFIKGTDKQAWQNEKFKFLFEKTFTSFFMCFGFDTFQFFFLCYQFQKDASQGS